MLRTLWPAIIGLILFLCPQPGAAQDNPWRVPGAAPQPGYGQPGGYSGQTGNSGGQQQGGYAGQQGYGGQGAYYGWNSSQTTTTQIAPQPSVAPPQPHSDWQGYASLGNSGSDARPPGMSGNTMMDASGSTLGRPYPPAQSTQQGWQSQYAAVPQPGVEQRYAPPPQQQQPRQQAPIVLGDFPPMDRDVTQAPAPGTAAGQPQQTPSWSKNYAGSGATGNGQVYAPPPQQQPQVQQRAPAPPAAQPQPYAGQGGYAQGYGQGGYSGYGGYGAYGGSYGDPAFTGPSTLNAPYPGGHGSTYGTGVPGFYGWQ